MYVCVFVWCVCLCVCERERESARAYTHAHSHTHKHLRASSAERRSRHSRTLAALVLYIQRPAKTKKFKKKVRSRHSRTLAALVLYIQRPAKRKKIKKRGAGGEMSWQKFVRSRTTRLEAAYTRSFSVLVRGEDDTKKTKAVWALGSVSRRAKWCHFWSRGSLLDFCWWYTSTFAVRYYCWSADLQQ